MSKLFNTLPIPRNGIIGHRGMAARAPENTLAGFKAAATFGLNWVEFDIQRCASGEWMVFHDKTLERTTNGQGSLQTSSYQTLKALDAGTWFNPQFKNEPIPTLTETLICLAELKLHPNIEMKVFKDEPGYDTNAIANFLSVLKQIWPRSLPPPLVSSFDYKTLAILRSLDKTLPLGFVIDNPTIETRDRTLEAGFDTLHCRYESFLPTLLGKMPVFVYTVNDPHKIKELLQNGVSAVFSDITNDINF